MSVYVNADHIVECINDKKLVVVEAVQGEPYKEEQRDEG